MFGLFKSKRDRASRPRWGFSAGWDDYLAEVRAQLQRRHLVLDDRALETGVVELPETADYEAWDLRGVTERCRDASPEQWESMIEDSLDEAFGTPAPAPKVEVVDSSEARGAKRSAPTSHGATAASRFDPPLERGHLRVQLFAGKLAEMFGPTVAQRPLGDAAMVIVADFGVAEHTLQWQDIEQLGLDRDEAFLLARRNAAAQMLDTIQAQGIGLPGANGEILVSNAFFLGGAMLEIREHMPPGTPLVISPITWHHWVSFEVQPGATRQTLASIRDFVAQLAGSITTIRNMSAWVTQSLWWWPTGTAMPVVIAPDGELPDGLRARLE